MSFMENEWARELIAPSPKKRVWTGLDGLNNELSTSKPDG